MHEQMFYEPRHRLIFTAMQDLVSQDNAVDEVTIIDTLTTSSKLKAAGGITHITNLKTATPMQGNFKKHIEILRDQWVRRKAIAVASKLQQEAYGENAGEKSVGIAIEELFALEQSQQQEWIPAAVGVVDAYNKLEIESKQKTVITGVPTGYTDIDNMVGGLPRGEVTIIAARPAMGKSAIALNIAESVAKNGGVVGFFSIEMPSTRLFQRLLSAHSNVPQNIARSGNAGEKGWGRLADSMSAIATQSLYVWEDAELDTADIRAQGMKLQRKHGKVDLLVVDYLQLIHQAGKGSTRNEEIGLITWALKVTAKKLNCAMLVLSQLRRIADGGRERRPTMSDLRDSGSIEQDAAQIWLLSKDEEIENSFEDYATTIVDVVKNREGDIGERRLLFNKPVTRYDSISQN